MRKDGARTGGTALAWRVGAPALAAAVALAAVSPPPAAAQRPEPCAAGETAALGSLGISGLDCDCELDAATGELRFRSAPEVSGVARNGPADGLLRAGDVLLAVDGVSVTSAAGVRRLQATSFSEPVELRIRRDGRERTVTIRPEPCRIVAAPDAPRVRSAIQAAPGRVTPPTPAPAVRAPRTRVAPPSSARIEARPGRTPPAGVGARDLRATPTPAPPVRAPRARVAPPTPPAGVAPGARAPAQRAERAPRRTPPTPPAGVGTPDLRATPVAPQRVSPPGSRPPDGWLGIGLRCSDCSLQTLSDGRIRWSFTEEPVVMSVEPNSPADRAGLRAGDVLTHINGNTLTSSAGERAFSEIQPGQTVRLTFERNGRRVTATLVAATRPASTERGAEAELRYIEMLEAERSRSLARRGLQVDTPRATQADVRRQADELARLRSSELRLRQSQAAGEALERALLAEQRSINPEVYAQLMRQLAELQAQAERAASQTGAQREEVAAVTRRFQELESALQQQQVELEARIRAEESERAVVSNDPIRFAGRVGSADVEVRGTSNVITRILRQGQEIVIITPDGEIRIRAVGGGGEIRR